MSTIHEALKQAQAERERAAPAGEHSAGGGGRRRRLRLPALGWLAAGAGALLLAFGVHSWFDSRAPEFPAPGPRAETTPAARPGIQRSRTDALYEEAKRLHAAGRLEEAEDLYRQVLVLDPGHKAVLNNLGVLRLGQGEYSEAESLLRKAIRVDPETVEPYYNLACLYALSGRIEQSLGYLRRALQMDPEVITWCREDQDLQSLRGLPEFDAILGAAAGTP